MKYRTEIHNKFIKSTFHFIDEFYNYTLRITGKKKTADKLLLKAFIAGYRFFVNLDDDTDYKAWMFRVLRNTYNGYFKKTDMEITDVDYGEIDNSYKKIRSFFCRKNIPANEALEGFSAAEITEIFNSVPEKFRLVLILIDIQNFSYPEAADFIDCPVTLVNKRISYARKLLFCNLFQESRRLEITNGTYQEFETGETGLSQMITAFTDDEISDENLKNKIMQVTESDPDAFFDLDLQRSIKRLIRFELRIIPTPEKLRRKLERKIYSEPEYKTGSLIPMKKINSKPAYSYSIIFVLLIALILLIFNLPLREDYKNDYNTNADEKNLVQLAENSFIKYLNAELSEIFLTDKTKDIESFFEDRGVDYSIFVALPDTWKPVGAFITKEGKRKFPNFIYRSDAGNTLFILQIEKKYLNNNHTVTLAEDLLNYLETGNCYIESDSFYVKLLYIKYDNIIAAVSDITKKEIEELFCNNNK